jgi:hypothetical protein
MADSIENCDIKKRKIVDITLQAIVNKSDGSSLTVPLSGKSLKKFHLSLSGLFDSTSEVNVIVESVENKKKLELYFESFIGAANPGNTTSTLFIGQIPLEFRPTSSTSCTIMIDNGSIQDLAFCKITSAGRLTISSYKGKFYSEGDGELEIPAFQISYLV